MDGAWGRRPRTLVALVRTSVAAVIGALALSVLAAPVGASTPRRSDPGTQSVSGVRVILYSQMCDNGNQHSRLNVRNFNSSPVSVFVSDPQARVTYTPGGPIPAGKGMLVHLVADPRAPGRDVTLQVEGGGSITFHIPEFNCAPTNPTVISAGGENPPAGNTEPVVDPVSTQAAGTAAAKPATTVKSGSLALTGADTRFLAAVATLFVLLGAGFLVMQVRLDCSRNLLVGEELPRRGILGRY